MSLFHIYQEVHVVHIIIQMLVSLTAKRQFTPVCCKHRWTNDNDTQKDTLSGRILLVQPKCVYIG